MITVSFKSVPPPKKKTLIIIEKWLVCVIIRLIYKNAHFIFLYSCQCVMVDEEFLIHVLKVPDVHFKRISLVTTR